MHQHRDDEKQNVHATLGVFVLVLHPVVRIERVGLVQLLLRLGLDLFPKTVNVFVDPRARRVKVVNGPRDRVDEERHPMRPRFVVGVKVKHNAYFRFPFRDP